MPDALALVATAAGKLTLEGLRLTGRGGTALPGLIALTLDPDFISALAGELPLYTRNPSDFKWLEGLIEVVAVSTR